jgi:mannan endo-1,4-beta-mannosidase
MNVLRQSAFVSTILAKRAKWLSMRRDDFEFPAETLSQAAPAAVRRGSAMPWIRVEGSYFVSESGQPWTPIGQNDAISWVEFKGLFRRRDLPAVERHLAWLADHGVTCLRLMLEYAQVRHRYIERPVGNFVPNMVQLWDDLFALCEKHGMRILLTPFDTFWTWLHWSWHPYNRKNGGCLDRPSRILLCGETRKAIKARLTFAVERWGGSGALFAWDLWNEIHPAHAQDSADCFGEFIHDLSDHVRRLELKLYGRAHPQTVSLFGPELWWKPHLELKEPIFRHPSLDFASIHIYHERTIDHPKDTVAPALAMGRIVRESLAEMPDKRPFFDSEHGPIHAFKDKHITLPEAFDDEYFRHMQWAHLASGGAGGGMRWPNRKPHVLTHGMRRAQHAMARFMPLIDWPALRRVNLNEEVKVSNRSVAACACGDARQAVVWLLRTDTKKRKSVLPREAAPLKVKVLVPGLEPGRYSITPWDTEAGTPGQEISAQADAAGLSFDTPPFRRDLALAIRRS